MVRFSLHRTRTQDKDKPEDGDESIVLVKLRPATRAECISGVSLPCRPDRRSAALQLKQRGVLLDLARPKGSCRDN